MNSLYYSKRMRESEMVILLIEVIWSGDVIFVKKLLV